ncbi:DNA-binding GntR family transcriptional regulator [Paenibacillus phyllosphaerae]|uniref:DNA-binding GntR family transcriptional regulator n=1 Tax=Paenibacillus phyllosphaerae TaxID=274593 RepID=A0A7W5B3Z6_9BACL|nr:GntR family transcriptional regulator [Paenibacillus phyllosphaerae]MBB3113989.1 DNA-binding GntR family transcriptional regulator [Paenibacillus phyllosphaerae]
MSDLPLVEIAYQSLRGQLLDGAYLPGELFSESELAAKLGMSRTPIRAAVSLLEKEGFVQTLYKRGILVKGIDVKDLYDIFDLLGALYSFALDRIDSDVYELDLKAMRQHYEQLVRASEGQKYREYYENGLMFMRTMLAAVQNRFILETFDLHRDKLLFFVVTYRLTQGANRPYTGRKLYEDIYHKLEQNQYMEAKAIIQQHNRNMREDLMRNGITRTS